ncbi:MAG: hypothetical protein HC904_10590 [Blastochloris sp.]|nr:hypothetical protein [Blastochloris sp.]
MPGSKINLDPSDWNRALLYRRFPNRQRLAAPHLTSFQLKRILLLSAVAVLVAILATLGFLRWTWENMLAEKTTRLESEERIERMNHEISRLQLLSHYSAEKNLNLARIFHQVVESGVGDQKRFLSLMVPEALRIQISHGIPASATVAMSIYESAYGRSELAGTANNFFGIKAFASVWDGPSVHTVTRDQGRKTKASFRKYPDLESAVLGYANFLKDSDRYEKAFQHRNGPAFVREVLQAGYCPDRDYLDHILTIMERHHLLKLDLSSSIALATPPSTVPHEMIQTERSP